MVFWFAVRTFEDRHQAAEQTNPRLWFVDTPQADPLGDKERKRTCAAYKEHMLTPLEPLEQQV